MTFIESQFAAPDPTQDRVPSPGRTLDLDSTSDLQRAPQEHTKDLAPSTSDFEPEIVSHSPAPAFGPPKTNGTLGPGRVLADRFLIERLLGSGGTSIVYQARDLASGTGAAPNKRVALKAPRPEVTDHARAAARLHHEFQITQRLAHPNIVRVLELYEAPHQCFMTMELIEGKPLSSLVRDWTMLSRPLAYKIIRACGQALAHAHGRDVVHGDFKPGNVFVTRDEQVKVLDFGAAAATSGDGSAWIPAGTPAYASPEVLDGATPDRRDDVFSFACVAYEMLTGQHPFDRLSSQEARAQGKVPQRPWNLSAPQWLALLSALSWERAVRPENVATLAGALVPESEPAVETAPIQPTVDIVSRELPPELMQPQRGWGFFLFLACAVAVTFIASQRQSGPDPAEEKLASASPAAPGASFPIMGKTVDSAMQQAVAAGAASSASPDDVMAEPDAAGGTSVAAPNPAQAVPASEISFEDREIVTSEGSVAAVFLVKRSPPLQGRARVQWSAHSGTADVGIDFASNASGTVEFADGQAQRAIYVPLRPDLLKEGDETFTVRLHGSQNARIGKLATAEATIRDDD